jgi:hypothetical protein
MRIGLWNYLKFIIGIGPIDVVTWWDNDQLMVEERCLITGKPLRTFVVEFEWPTSLENMVEWRKS